MTPGSAPQPQSFWDDRAACNFIGGGTGAGLLVFAAAGALAGQSYFLPGIVGLGFVAFGLMMVWLEIGRPLRAINVLFRPQTSWMSRESIAALILFLTGSVALASAWPGTGHLQVLSSPLVPALLTALVALVFLSCQLGMLHATRGVPAWRAGTLLPLVGVSGLAEGLGIYLILMSLWGSVSPALLIVALGLIIARALAWQVYQMTLDRSGVPPPTRTAFAEIQSAYLALGHGLPLVLIGVASLWPEQARPLTVLAGAAVTLAGWWFKLVLITKAAHTRGFTLSVVPVRGGR
jgi:phenylacetyl-CoA:acceptor oxidoreductase subunit 2